MKVLYLSIPGIRQPWYDDFLAAVGGRFQVSLFDPARPLAEQFAGVDVVVDQGGSVGTREMIDAAVAAGVKLWQVLGTGLDHVDVPYFLAKGMPLANTPGHFSAVALAEHALFLMLYFAKNFPESQRNLRARVFWRPLNDELEGRVLALVGLGASARELARRARPFGMRILAIDAVEVPASLRQDLGLEFFGGPDQLDRLAAEADYLSLHLPLTSATRHLINARVLGLMKPTAVLINVARGEIVDEQALIVALRERRIRGAGLDVFSQEPLDPNHPLLQLDNVVATPHVAGVTTGTSRRRGQACAENIARLAQGLPPLYLVTSAD